MQERKASGGYLSFYWSEFLVGFCGRMPLLLVTILTVAAITTPFGSYFGLPGLVYHDQPLAQFGVGMILGLVTVQSLLVGFLLRREGRSPGEGEPPLDLWAYVRGIFVCMVVTLAAIVALLWVTATIRDFRYPKLWAESVAAYAAGSKVAWYGLPGLAGVGVALLFTKWLYPDREPSWSGGLHGWLRDSSAVVERWLPRRLGFWVLTGMVLLGLGLYEGVMYLETVVQHWGWFDVWTCLVLPFAVLLLASYLLLLLALIHSQIAGAKQEAARACQVAGAETAGGETSEPATLEPSAAPECAVPPPSDPDLGFGYLFFLLGSGLMALLASLPQVASPLVAVGLLFFVLLGFYGAVASLVSRLTPVVWLIAAAVILLAGLPVYRYEIPGLEEYYAQPVTIDSVYGVGPPIQQANEPLRLLQQSQLGFVGKPPEPENRDRPRRPLIVVAASGGGVRSTAWTLRVLQRLEMSLAAEGIDFPAHVRIITGASGGMVGAAAYTSGLLDTGSLARAAGSDERKRRYEAMVNRYGNITNDSLTPVVNTLVFRDMPCFFSPFNRGYDRGRRLQDSWNRLLGGMLDCKFATLLEGERQGRIPSLIFTPMLVEDGRRLVISNLDLANVLSNAGNQIVPLDPDHPVLRDNYSVEALELFKLFPGAQDTLSLATAARLSASFPYITPAAHLPTVPRRRVVDAGYYDNYGVGLIASWLNSSETQEWIHANVSGIVLVQIRDTPSEDERRLLKIPPDRSTPLSRALEQVITPPEGLWAMRDASSSFRNDSQLELLSQYYNRREELQREGAVQSERLRNLTLRTRERVINNQKGAADAIDFISKELLPEINKMRDEMVSMRSAQGLPSFHQPFFTVVTFELPHGKDVPLSWYLSEREQQAIRDTAPYPPLENLGENGGDRVFAKTFEGLLRWWRARQNQTRGPALK